MNPELLPVIVAGGIGIAGSLLGVGLTTWLGRAAERRRLAEEDARRWLVDRRHAYSQFLALSESMLREIDEVAVFLSYDGCKPVPAEDELLISDGLAEYVSRWHEELQPALGEVQLLAEGRVADLADRVSGALMELTSELESRGAFTSFYPTWFRAHDLLGVLRNAMRTELGLGDDVEVTVPREAPWPWLADRPSEEDYIRRQEQIPGRPPLTAAEQARISGDL